MAVSGADNIKADMAIEGTNVIYGLELNEQPKHPRSIKVTLTGGEGNCLSGIVRVFGYTANGYYKWTDHAVTPGNLSIETDYVFQTLNAVQFVGTGGAGDSMDIGRGSKFLLASRIDPDYDREERAILSVHKNGILIDEWPTAIKNYQVNSIYNTIDFETKSDGSAGTAIDANDDFIVRYREAINSNLD